MYDNDYMWPSESKMFPVWPFTEKKGPVTLFTVLLCLRTSVSTTSGPHCRFFAAFGLADPFPNILLALGVWSAWTTSASGCKLDVDTGSLTSSQRAGERGSWGVHPLLCPEHRLRQARPSTKGHSSFRGLWPVPFSPLESGTCSLSPLGPRVSAPWLPCDFLHSSHTCLLTSSLKTLHFICPKWGLWLIHPTHVTILGQEGETRNRKLPSEQLCLLSHSQKNLKQI